MANNVCEGGLWSKLCSKVGGRQHGYPLPTLDQRYKAPAASAYLSSLQEEKDGLKHYRSSRDPLPPDQPLEEIEKEGVYTKLDSKWKDLPMRN
jgi:hypothetical protein